MPSAPPPDANRGCLRANEVGAAALPVLFGAGLALFLAGCSGGQPAAVEMPAFSPEDAAGQAMAQYDTNKDGFLDDEELKRCPALRGAVSKIDKNGDGKLTKEEIVQRL